MAAKNEKIKNIPDIPTHSLKVKNTEELIAAAAPLKNKEIDIPLARIELGSSSEIANQTKVLGPIAKKLMNISNAINDRIPLTSGGNGNALLSPNKNSLKNTPSVPIK